MSKTERMKVTCNADGLGVAKGMLVMSQVDVGDYQGQTVVLLDDTDYDSVHIYVISYGSCGGCDWYEEFYGKEPTYKDCILAWQDEKPRYIFPKSKLPSGDELWELLYEKDSGYQGMNEAYGWTKDAAKDLLGAAELAQPNKSKLEEGE